MIIQEIFQFYCVLSACESLLWFAGHICLLPGSTHTRGHHIPEASYHSVSKQHTHCISMIDVYSESLTPEHTL